MQKDNSDITFVFNTSTWEIIDEIKSSQEIYKKANFEINKIISRLENIKKKIDK